MAHSQTSKYNLGSVKFTALLFGEGGRDRKFINQLLEIKQFKYRFDENWRFSTDNATGGSPKTILLKCKQASENMGYDLVVCFIDLDQLILENPRTYKTKTIQLALEFPNISIFWNQNCLEEEIQKNLGLSAKGKKRINRLADKNIEKFVNTPYWKKFIKIIEKREKELEKEKNI